VPGRQILEREKREEKGGSKLGVRKKVYQERVVRNLISGFPVGLESIKASERLGKTP